MKWILPITATALLGCQVLRSEADLNPGDVPPTVMHSGGNMTVALVARLDDCLNCDLRGVFAALRALQRRADGASVSELVVVSVTRNALDTLVFRYSLNNERVTGRIKTISPRSASRFFDGRKLPAMYLIEDGRVVREWESRGSQGAIVIGRSEIIEAVAKQH